MEEIAVMPVSFWQEGLWLMNKQTPGAPIYNLPYAIRLQGVLDVSALEMSMKSLIARHEILRTNFTEIAGEPAQVINPAKPACWLYTDLGHLEESSREPEAARMADQEASKPFDLTCDTLLRTVLLRLDPTDHILLVTTHNIILDAWSLELLIQEVTAIYEAITNGAPVELASLTLQFADFAVWQRERFQGEAVKSELAYWKNRLGGRIPVVELPTDRPRPAKLTHKAMAHSITLSHELAEAVRNSSKKNGVTLFTTFLAAANALLYFYTGQDEITIGTPITLRGRAELKRVPGYLYNILILRTDMSGDPTFDELSGRARGVAREAFAHQDLPFEVLRRELATQDGPYSEPPIKVMFIFVTLDTSPRELLQTAELKVTPFARFNRTAKFYLTIKVIEVGQNISISFEYSTDLFESETVARMLRRFERLIQTLNGNDRQPLSALRASTAV